MLFRILRRFFRDDEFEEKQRLLSESSQVLAQYRDYIEDQKAATDKAKESVDADFLTLIWASIAAALAFGSEAVNHFPGKRIVFDTPGNIVWSAFALASAAFVLLNLYVAADLTVKYATAKKDPSVKTFAMSLLLGMAALVVGVVLLAGGLAH